MALPIFTERLALRPYEAGDLHALHAVLYSDEQETKLRYKYAPDESFDHAAAWLYEGMGEAYKSGAARLAITGGNPALLANEDPDKVGRANRAQSKAYRPALERITRHEINWTIVAAATPAWAPPRSTAAISGEGPASATSRATSISSLWGLRARRTSSEWLRARKLEQWADWLEEMNGNTRRLA